MPGSSNVSSILFLLLFLPRQAAGERRSEELRRADKRRLKKDERDRRSDDSHRGGCDKPTGRENKKHTYK